MRCLLQIDAVAEQTDVEKLNCSAAFDFRISLAYLPFVSIFSPILSFRSIIFLAHPFCPKLKLLFTMAFSCFCCICQLQLNWRIFFYNFSLPSTFIWAPLPLRFPLVPLVYSLLISFGISVQFSALFPHFFF